jgi:hypothetical protein
MDIQSLIRLCEQKLTYLNSLLATATVTGNQEEVGRIEIEIGTTIETIQKLKSLIG